MIHVSASQFIGLWGCLSRSFRECRRDASFKFWSWTWRSMLNISIAFWIHDWNQLQATTINTGRAEIYISWVDGASRGVPGSGRFVYGDPGKIFEPRYRETVELPPSRLIINHKLSKDLAHSKLPDCTCAQLQSYLFSTSKKSTEQGCSNLKGFNSDYSTTKIFQSLRKVTLHSFPDSFLIL